MGVQILRKTEIENLSETENCLERVHTIPEASATLDFEGKLDQKNVQSPNFHVISVLNICLLLKRKNLNWPRI